VTLKLLPDTNEVTSTISWFAVFGSMTAVKGNDVGQPVFEVRFIVVTTLVMEDASVVAVAALAKFRVDITAPYQPVPVKVTRPEPEIVSVKSAAVLEMVPPKSQYAMTGLVAALPGVLS